MTKSSQRLFWSCALLLLLTACAQELRIPEGLRDFADAAVADLAARESIDAGDIVVQLGEFVTWPDASLGCPRPGQFYAQVITEGYRIVLRTESGEHAYHGATGRAAVLCQN